MSLVQFIDELFNPQDIWTSAERRRLQNNLSTIKNGMLQVPAIDLYTVEGGLELKADLPGYKKDDVRIDVQGQVLTLSGERTSQTERDEARWHYAERHYGKFSRKVKLPFNIEVGKISAKYDNGVLTVNIPQPENPIVGQVQIQ